MASFCSTFENLEYRRLCEEIQDGVDEVKTAVNGNTDTQAQGVKNYVGYVQNNLISYIISNANNIINNLSTTRASINNNVNLQAESTRSVVQNSQKIINDNINNRSAQLSNQVQQVQQNILQRLNQDVQDNRAQTEEIVNRTAVNILTSSSFIAQTINSVKTALETKIDNNATTIGDEVKRIITNVTEGLSDIANKIWQAILTIFQPFIDWLNGIIQAFLNWFNTTRQNAANSVFEFGEQLTYIFEKLTTNKPGSPIAFLNTLFSPDNSVTLAQILLAGLLLIPNALNIANVAFRPYLNDIEQQMNVIHPSTLLDGGTIIAGLWKGTITPQLAVQHLTKAGYDSEMIQAIFNTYKQVLNISDVQQLFYRGFINRSQVEKHLAELGFGDVEVDYLLALFDQLPPIQDVIRFAVRESYTPQVVARYDLDEDLPPEFINEARRRGLSENNAKYYWRAHWELPPLNMGYEMFHRQIINRDDLLLLMKTQDVMPFWRDKLLQMNYALPTRVDTRRLFQTGIWSRDEVKRNYTDLGYDDKIAEALTRFTEIEYDPDDFNNKNSPKLVTRSLIERAYLRNNISRNEAVDKLKELGYTAEAIDLILDSARASNSLTKAEKIQDSIENRIQNVIVKLYVNGTIPLTDAVNHLNLLGYTNEEAQSFLETAIIERELGVQDQIIAMLQDAYIQRTVDESELITIMTAAGFEQAEINNLLPTFSLFRDIRVKKPTLAQLESFVKLGIISIDNFAEEIRGLGYADQYVDMFVQRLILKGGD